MKIIAVIVVFLTFMATASAAPFLVSDNQATATSYQITGGPAWLPTTVLGTAIRIDLANYQPGTWELKARACKTDPAFGVQCSPEGNFTLSCPEPTGGLTAPVLSIVP
jgi:hypothetical protein